MVGDDRTTTEVTKLISQLPPAVQALTGVDLSEVINILYNILNTKPYTLCHMCVQESPQW